MRLFSDDSPYGVDLIKVWGQLPVFSDERPDGQSCVTVTETV